MAAIIISSPNAPSVAKITSHKPWGNFRGLRTILRVIPISAPVKYEWMSELQPNTLALFCLCLHILTFHNDQQKIKLICICNKCKWGVMCLLPGKASWGGGTHHGIHLLLGLGLRGVFPWLCCHNQKSMMRHLVSDNRQTTCYLFASSHLPRGLWSARCYDAMMRSSHRPTEVAQMFPFWFWKDGIWIFGAIFFFSFSIFPMRQRPTRPAPVGQITAACFMFNLV